MSDEANKPEGESKPANTGRLQTGRFPPGVSGNPAGKPKGARHKTTVLLESIMRDNAEKVMNAVLKSAQQGDTAAARLIIDRVAPARKDATIEFELPQIKTTSDAVAATGAILQAVSAGDISPGEGETLSSMVASVTRVIETEELERRLSALEQAIGGVK
jgi:hypothetical protein